MCVWFLLPGHQTEVCYQYLFWARQCQGHQGAVSSTVFVYVCMYYQCVGVSCLQYHHLSDHLFAAAFDNGLLQVRWFIYVGFPSSYPPSLLLLLSFSSFLLLFH